MNIKRVLAGGLAALMAGSTMTLGALAQNATTPTWTIADSADAWFAYNNNDASGATVVYAGAAETEVGAALLNLDLKTTTFVDAVAKIRDPTSGAIKPGAATGATTAVVGELSRDTIALPTGSAGTALSAGFPNSGVLTNTHFAGLKDSTFDYKGTSYDYREQVDVAGVAFRHGLSVSNINGTEKMVVESSDIKYQFVFEKAVNITTSSGTSNKGSVSNPDLQNPVQVELLGKKFLVVGVSSNQAKVLQGTVGSGLTKDKGVQHGDYTLYAEQGSNANWATIVLKDKTGKVVATDTIDQDKSKDFTSLALTVKVTQVRALQDGTILGVDLVVGKTGEVEKTYDTSSDVSSATADRFPGETEWGLAVSGMATLGQLSVNDRIDVEYKPAETKYLIVGQSVKLPNNYGELKFQGFNTESFSTVTIKPVTSQTIYNSTGNLVSNNYNLAGIQVEGDVAGSVTTKGGLSGSNAVNKVAWLWNRTQAENGNYTVVFAKWDTSNSQWRVNDTLSVTGGREMSAVNCTTGSATCALPELPVWVYNSSLQNNFVALGDGAAHNVSLRYGASGDQAYNLTVFLRNGSINGDVTANNTFPELSQMRIAKPGSAWSLNLTWTNKSAATTAAAPEFRLGVSATTSETTEVVVLSEGATATAGKQSNDVVTDSGLILVNADTNGAADTVKIKVPSKDLLIKARFGSVSATTTGTPTYATLDDALAQVKAGTLAKNLILVGGPCANSVVEELAKADANDTLPTCTEWVGDPAKPKYTKGLIGVWNVGTTGKKALIIAGTLKTNTDELASEFKLKGTTTLAAA